MSKKPLFEAPLYIVDLNIDPQKAYNGARDKHLERIAPGVYVNCNLAPDVRREVILRNSARIASLAYANGGILAGSSAYHRGAVEGHLLLATPWGGKPMDVGGVFTIYFTRSQVDVGMNREVEHVSIKDDFGDYTVKRLADEMLIIKNFQPQRGRPRATFLNNKDLIDVVERSSRQLGGNEKLMNRLQAMLKHHGLDSYQRQIEKFVESTANYTQTARPLKSFRVYWHDDPVATMTHDGHIWSFDYERSVGLQLSVHERKGSRSTPAFMGSLLPEVGLDSDAAGDEKLDGFELGARYISNITVHPVGVSTTAAIIPDVLRGNLDAFTSARLEFNGHLDNFMSETAADDVLLSRMQVNPAAPRISGMQVKLAAHLDERGVLAPAIDKAFTHILKLPAGQSGFASLGSMEWFSLTIARQCALKVEKFALVDLKGRGPGLLVERFDIRRDFNDKRMLMTEDFWSVFGMQQNKQKYEGELLDVANTLVKHSTNISEDGKNLLALAAFSWLTFNSDMHLKNLLLLKEADSVGGAFSKVTLSPVYDVLCTQVYEGDAKSSAISLAGKREHTLAGFRTLGKKFNMTVEEVDTQLDYLAVSIPMWARRIAADLPAAIKKHELSVEHIEHARSLMELRCQNMLAELEGAQNYQSRKGADAEAEEAAQSFSAEGIVGGNGNVAELVEAEKRRSWLPDRPAAAKKPPSRPRP